jgi:hypothetical protein
MIKSGDIIKHKASMDVAIQVLYASEHPDNGDVEIRGIWLNQGQTKSFIINTRKYPAGVPVDCVIKKHQLSNWFKCARPDSKFIRNEEWKQL